MTRNSFLRQTGLNLFVWGTVLSGLSCGGGDPVAPPTTPSVRVIITTSGSFLPESYQVRLVTSTDFWYPVATTDTVEITDLTPGEYQVYLYAIRYDEPVNMPPNCTVEGAGWGSTVTIIEGESRTVEITVSCVTPSAFSTLHVSTTTMGPGSDPDGYTVQVDDGEPQAMVAGGLTVPGLSPGVHAVFLGGLANNCHLESWATPDPPNPQYVTIDAYPDVGVSFMLWCGHSWPY